MSKVKIMGKYSRKVENLSKLDILALAHDKKLSSSDRESREYIVSEISKTDKNILNKNYKYYFILKDNFDLQVVSDISRASSLSYPEKPFDSDRRIDFNKVRKLIREVDIRDNKNHSQKIDCNLSTTRIEVKEKQSEEPQNEHNVELEENYPDEIEKMTNTIQTFIKTDSISEKQKHGIHNILGIKLKYEQSRGIDSFLSLIDSYASTYGITDQTEKVKIALLALDNSDHGLTVKAVLSKDDVQNWDAFRKKVQSLLGRDSESYRDEFESYAATSESPRLAIANLVTVYKFSFDPPKMNLTQEDEQEIIRTFVKAQKGMVRSLLLAEIKSLTLTNLGTRTQRLIQAFEPVRFSSSDKTKNVMNIEQHKEIVQTGPESFEPEEEPEFALEDKLESLIERITNLTDVIESKLL